ncbi:hypothetical protein FSP39_016862 [Pinctada imbricata]|uniref:Uncharacterized protein n=1 Tax=Pinctada imbricata TaxID=66713 RepID=A0AA88Y8W6_PINIB|nr:hypothetical protein FSP39_016862 [Pinctada imbricata]
MYFSKQPGELQSRQRLLKFNVNLHHIESRPSKQCLQDFDFFVSCDNKTGGLREALDEIRGKSKYLAVLSRGSDDTTGIDSGN